MLLSKNNSRASSDIIYPCAGHVFGLKDHRNEDFNQRYLIINVRHEGKQPNVLEEEAGLHFLEGEDDHVTSYHNEMEFCRLRLFEFYKHFMLDYQYDINKNRQPSAAANGAYSGP